MEIIEFNQACHACSTSFFEVQCSYLAEREARLLDISLHCDGINVDIATHGLNDQRAHYSIATWAHALTKCVGPLT